MIKSVTVVNYLGESLELQLPNSNELTGIYISQITGIGPGKANINTVSLASDDGGIYNSARLEIRNIVLTLGFYQSVSLKNSIEDARQLTYKYFPTKRPLTLIFETDNRSLYIDGYVESNEPDIFSDKETTQISIICPDPKFYNAIGSSYIDFSGIESLFEFPYSNESLTEDLTEFGTFVVNVDKELFYDGDEETGVTIHIHPKSSVTGLRIANIATNENISIDDTAISNITGAGISAYDEIYINTVKGKKSATLTRAGVTYNIINALGRNPGWFQLVKGRNVFTYTATTGAIDTVITIYYNIAFAGV